MRRTISRHGGAFIKETPYQRPLMPSPTGFYRPSMSRRSQAPAPTPFTRTRYSVSAFSRSMSARKSAHGSIRNCTSLTALSAWKTRTRK